MSRSVPAAEAAALVEAINTIIPVRQDLHKMLGVDLNLNSRTDLLCLFEVTVHEHKTKDKRMMIDFQTV